MDTQDRDELTMNVALTFIRLCDEKIGDMSTYCILIAHSVSTKDLLKAS